MSDEVKKTIAAIARKTARDIIGNMLNVNFAVVTALSGGRAVIKFDGDTQASQKIYKAFKSYSPAVGDRVILINNIIIGGWRP